MCGAVLPSDCDVMLKLHLIYKLYYIYNILWVLYNI